MYVPATTDTKHFSSRLLMIKSGGEKKVKQYLQVGGGRNKSCHLREVQRCSAVFFSHTLF